MSAETQTAVPVELWLRKSIPYAGLTFACFWVSLFQWQVALLIPAILFQGLGATLWSAMRQREIRAGGGRFPSKERLLELVRPLAEDGCIKARNLQRYRLIAPFFWAAYAAVVLIALMSGA